MGQAAVTERVKMAHRHARAFGIVHHDGREARIFQPFAQKDDAIPDPARDTVFECREGERAVQRDCAIDAAVGEVSSQSAGLQR